MRPLALVGPGQRVSCEGAVPGEGCGVVFGAVGVCAVEDGGFERGVGGVLVACGGGGGGGGGIVGYGGGGGLGYYYCCCESGEECDERER